MASASVSTFEVSSPYVMLIYSFRATLFLVTTVNNVPNDSVLDGKPMRMRHVATC